MDILIVSSFLEGVLHEVPPFLFRHVFVKRNWAERLESPTIDRTLTSFVLHLGAFV